MSANSSVNSMYCTSSLFLNIMNVIILVLEKIFHSGLMTHPLTSQSRNIRTHMIMAHQFPVGRVRLRVGDLGTLNLCCTRNVFFIGRFTHFQHRIFMHFMQLEFHFSNRCKESVVLCVIHHQNTEKKNGRSYVGDHIVHSSLHSKTETSLNAL